MIDPVYLPIFVRLDVECERAEAAQINDPVALIVLLGSAPKPAIAGKYQIVLKNGGGNATAVEPSLGPTGHFDLFGVLQRGLQVGVVAELSLLRIHIANPCG